MKIAVLVSGGVDSSVALKLLKDQGHDITAFYLKIWLEDELAYLGDCPWQEDLYYVTKVCEQVGVPLEVISLQREYWDQVVSYTVAEVKAGRTPNPDVLCNSRVKFGAFYKALEGKGFDKIATGHYACVRSTRVAPSLPAVAKGYCVRRSWKRSLDGGHGSMSGVEGDLDIIYELHASPDLVKDQTYFLANLTQEQLSKAMFPIGHLTKPELRQLAQKFDLPNKDRKDSQGICFLGKIKFRDFIEEYLGTKKGDIIEFETGKKLAEHEGFWFYTIGQRQGIGLSGGPWYVVSKDVENNIVYISKNYHNIDKPRDKFTVGEFNWISRALLSATQGRLAEMNIQVKLRHGETKYNCSIEFIDNNEAIVTIDKNDQGIAAGQFAVFYDGDICLGSAVILEAL